MSKPSGRYDADYYLRGKQTGKSLYENYRWLPELTIPMAQRIAAHLGIEIGHSVFDFGCARGYLVRALRELGYDAFGYDVSEWAITNADEKVAKYLTRDKLVAFNRPRMYDWCVAKDVLEHCEFVQYAIDGLLLAARRGVFAVVPLTAYDGSGHRYVVEEYEADVTHCQRHTLIGWMDKFIRPGWRVEGAYRVPGVKDNYAHHERGNGFITARRIEE